MLQVQVYGVFGQPAGVREHDRAHRSLLPPLGQLLVLLAGRTQRVDGGGPTRVGGHAPAHIGKGPHRAPGAIYDFDERLRATELQGTGECITKRDRLEASPGTRGVKQIAAPVDLRPQLSLTFTRRLQLRLRELFALPVKILPLDLQCQTLDTLMGYAPAKTAFDLIVNNLRQAAQLAF